MRQRLRQFVSAGRRASESDFALASELLDGPLLQLFLAQHRRDVLHGIGTARWLLERGHDAADLVVVALVHDIGKGQQRRVDRVAYVLASQARAARALGDRESGLELRRAVARTLEHSVAGARVLREAGATERVVDLTLRHHEPPGDDPVLALLQQADSAS